MGFLLSSGYQQLRETPQPFREPAQDLPAAAAPCARALPHSSRSPTAPASQLDPWLLTETQAFAFVFLAHHVLLMLICLKPLSRFCLLTVAFGCTFVHVHSLFRSCSFLFCIFHPFHFSILVFFLAFFSAFPMPMCISCTVRIPIDETVTLGVLSLVILSPFSFLPGLDECSFRGSFLSCCSHSWCFLCTVLNKWNQQSRQCLHVLNAEHRVSPEACGPHSPIQGALENQRGNTLVV